MKFFILFLLLGTFQSLANVTYSQNVKMSLNMENATVRDVITAIEKQGSFYFTYSLNQINVDRRVSVKVKNGTVNQILENIFSESGVGYKIEDRHIVLYKKLNTEVPGTKQRKTLDGIVVDSQGEAIIGASVLERGTSNGTITDVDGRFTLQIDKDIELIVSYVGYVSKTVKTGSQTSLKIVLLEDSQLLNEVVVVGYGAQKKVNLTGAVSSVNTEDIKDRVQSNVLAAVQGTVPGVTIISRPGSTPSINFRGRGNLGTSEPLYVIDGAIANATLFSNLDPNSIESISFLKDAAASSIYGSRAAYGVVLVKTKEGKNEKMNVSYSGYIGMKMPTYLPDVLNSWEYASLLNEAMYNNSPTGGRNQAYSDEEVKKFKSGSDPDYYPNTDWADLVLDKHVATTQHSLNFSGGSEKIRYFAGVGYLYDDNFVPGINNDRYNFNINIQSDVTKWLTLKTDVKYIRNNSNTENGTPWLGNFVLVPSIMVAKQSNGEWGSIAGGKTATQSFLNDNPLRVLSYNDWSAAITENSIYNLGFDLKPLKGLVISGQLDYNRYENKNKSYTANHPAIKDFQTGIEIAGTGNTTPNSMSMHWISSDNIMTTLTARYNLNRKHHSFNILVGTSYEHYNYQRFYQKRTGFPVDGLEDIEVGGEISKEVPGGSPILESKMLSYFGRINYSFMDRYLFEANLRADGSSRFHKDQRWGVFPSFSAGWRISEEKFMSSIEWLDNLKIRASYGTLGNINNVGYYDYFQQMGSTNKTGSFAFWDIMGVNSSYSYGDTAIKGILETKIANKNLSWETVAISDIGIDADLLNGKLSFTADYYIKNTKDILLGYNVARETGIWTKPSMNLAKVRNQGFEFSLTHRNKIGDFSYSVSANIATNKNEIIDMGESNNMISGSRIRYILTEGEAIGSFYGLKTDGLYTKEEIEKGEFYVYGRKPNAGDIKYVPQRKDAKQYKDLTAEQKKNNQWDEASITNDDRTIIGNDVPDFTYGLNLSLQYKNFEFSLFGQGVGGTKVAFESEQVFAFMLNSNPRKYHLNRWNEENPNPNAIVPRLYGGTTNDEYNKYFSEYELFDADYFRIKSISLGYMVPQQFIKKSGISNLKLFITGENLFTFRADKDMKDFDPEAACSRAVGAYGVKSVAFGINLSF